MKTQLAASSMKENVRENLFVLLADTRSKIISAADVWNIQRNKRARVQRRFSL